MFMREWNTLVVQNAIYLDKLYENVLLNDVEHFARSPQNKWHTDMQKSF